MLKDRTCMAQFSIYKCFSMTSLNIFPLWKKPCFFFYIVCGFTKYLKILSYNSYTFFTFELSINVFSNVKRTKIISWLLFAVRLQIKIFIMTFQWYSLLIFHHCVLSLVYPSWIIYELIFLRFDVLQEKF